MGQGGIKVFKTGHGKIAAQKEENKLMDLSSVLALHKALDAKFAKDIIIMDLAEVSPIADYFVIATGGSAAHMAALAETTEQSLTDSGYSLSHIEGAGTSNWVLLDFGSVVVHLFDKESREYYHLERIWRDAKVVEPQGQ